MNTVRALTFVWAPWSIAVSLIAIAITAGLCFVAWKRSGFQRSIGLLEALRLTLVILGVILFNQPEWVEEYRPDEKPTVAILWDDSASMETRDVTNHETASTSVTTRREAIKKLTESPFWASLHEKMNVVIQSFGAADPTSTSAISHGTNLHEPLASALQRFKNLQAIVLSSDGDWNEGDPPVHAASALRLKGIPVFSIPVGSSSRLPDVELLSLDSPTFGITGKSVRIPFTVESTLPREHVATVKLKVSDGEEITKDVRIAAMGRTSDFVIWKPKGLNKTGGGNKDYIKQFPKGLDELSKFDVVFLGDVGLEDGQLTAEDCRLLKGLVEHQASGLVFMPGWQGREMTLNETELGDLCPVIFDITQPGGWGSRTPGHFELTELGRRSLLTKLADTQDDNMEVWEGLPGFQWYAPALRAKAGCEVLAVHKDVSNEFGRLPLLATRTYGAGKVLFMGTDGAWRWRKGVEDKYHYRFWGQVVRWMAYQRNMAKGETMRMYYSPEQPQVRQTIALSANVMEKSGEPLPKGDVTARIVAPSGKVETIRFQSSGDEWGAFSSRFIAEEPGKHDVVLACKQTGATLETSFFVQGLAVERIGRAARPEVLEEISRVTRGQVISLDRVEQVLKSLAALPEPAPSIRRFQLWCHPVVASVFIGLLGIFWIGRKIVGLI